MIGDWSRKRIWEMQDEMRESHPVIIDSHFAFKGLEHGYRRCLVCGAVNDLLGIDPITCPECGEAGTTDWSEI